MKDVVTLRFVREANPLSGGIAWFSHGQFSHVGALTDTGEEWGARNNRCGDKPPGVQLRPADYARFSRRVIFTIPVTTLQKQSVYAFLESQEGKPYDRRAIWGFVFNRDWREEDSWICSELIAAALESADVLPCLYVAANKIVPVDAALVCSVPPGVIITDIGANY